MLCGNYNSVKGTCTQEETLVMLTDKRRVKRRMAA